jgi:hypoxanthine-DNA glycosylase
VSQLRGLAPIFDDRARILILGSFPSPASLAAGQYYAHRQNQFWRIVGAILGQPLASLDYDARQAAVREAGLAIWDVYGACQRQGSLDAAIRQGEANDFATLAAEAPRITRVCFNGQTAGKFAPVLAALGYQTVILPSTSPANAGWSFERKLTAWSAALAA